MKPPKNTSRFASTRRNTFSTRWSRGLTLLFIIAALGSLVVLSSVFAEHTNTSTADDTGAGQLKTSALVLGQSNQDTALPSAATRVDVEPVKPKIFHGDVRRL